MRFYFKILFSKINRTNGQHMKQTILIVFFISITYTASATPLDYPPEWDIMATCKELADEELRRTPGSNHSATVRKCIDEETAERAEVRRIWPDYSETDREKCSKVYGRFSLYLSIKLCLASGQKKPRSGTIEDALPYRNPNWRSQKTSPLNPPLVEFPMFDVDALCADRYKGISPYGVKACVNTEQKSYDFLRLVWGDTPEATKRRCKQFYDGTRKKAASYVYTELAECIALFRQGDELEQQGRFQAR